MEYWPTDSFEPEFEDQCWAVEEDVLVEAAFAGDQEGEEQVEDIDAEGDEVGAIERLCVLLGEGFEGFLVIVLAMDSGSY